MTEITYTINGHTEQFTQQKHALCVDYWYLKNVHPKICLKYVIFGCTQSIWCTDS